MQCECCQESATVHLTDVSNGVKKEVHLCEDCAKKQGVTIKSHMHKPGAAAFEAQQMPATIATSGVFEGGAPELADGQSLRCAECGTTYRQFRTSGKLGCPRCYDAFGERLTELLEKIHGRGSHVGKIPARANDQIAREEELRDLRAELDAAVEGEAYERAAELRDRIYRLEGRAS